MTLAETLFQMMQENQLSGQPADLKTGTVTSTEPLEIATNPQMAPLRREVLYLTYFEGLSYAEAAEVMGKSVKQITNMVYRGKQSLRELLEKEGITRKQVSMAVKSSVIASIGPAIVILVTMISLIISMGAPVSWMRLSFIGSVNYEAMAAGFGAQAMGTTLDNLNPLAFTCGVWVMCCGSLGWLVFTLLFTDKMDKVNHLLSRGRQKMVPIISAGAMLGAFANLSSGNFFNAEGGFALTGAPAIATICGCVLMMILTKLARTKNINWLREWAFAIAMFTGMIIGSVWNSMV